MSARGRSGPGQLLALCAALCLVLGTAGCGTTPSEPSPTDWRTAARQSLDDVSSEVATVRLVLVQAEQDRLVGRYSTTAVTTAEEALGKAEDTLTTQQPPPGLDRDFEAVSTALGDAGDLVTEARIAVVRSTTSEYAGLVRRLDAMGTRLDRLRSSL